MTTKHNADRWYKDLSALESKLRNLLEEISSAAADLPRITDAQTERANSWQEIQEVLEIATDEIGAVASKMEQMNEA